MAITEGRTMKHAAFALTLFVLPGALLAQNRKQPELFQVPEIRSSWDDLTEGIETKDDWRKRRTKLKQRYLELLRDQYKPEKPPWMSRSMKRPWSKASIGGS